MLSAKGRRAYISCYSLQVLVSLSMAILAGVAFRISTNTAGIWHIVGGPGEVGCTTTYVSRYSVDIGRRRTRLWFVSLLCRRRTNRAGRDWCRRAEIGQYTSFFRDRPSSLFLHSVFLRFMGRAIRARFQILDEDVVWNRKISRNMRVSLRVLSHDRTKRRLRI